MKNTTCIIQTPLNWYPSDTYDFQKVQLVHAYKMRSHR